MSRNSLRPAAALALGLAMASPCAAADVTVTLPVVSGSPGAVVSIPITTSRTLAGLGVFSIDFRLTLDPAIVAASQAGTDGSVQNWGPPFTSATTSGVAEAAAGGTALTLPGTLLNTVSVQLKPGIAPGTVMPLAFQHFTFNNGTPTVATVNGSLVVVAPPTGVAPAAPGTLSLAVLATLVRSEARFEFGIPDGPGNARLAIYALDGRRVVTLATGVAPGAHSLTWDLRGAGGARVAAGLYFARLQQGAHALVRRLVVAG